MLQYYSVQRAGMDYETQKVYSFDDYPELAHQQFNRQEEGRERSRGEQIEPACRRKRLSKKERRFQAKGRLKGYGKLVVLAIQLARVPIGR